MRTRRTPYLLMAALAGGVACAPSEVSESPPVTSGIAAARVERAPPRAAATSTAGRDEPAASSAPTKVDVKEDGARPQAPAVADFDAFADPRLARDVRALVEVATAVVSMPAFHEHLRGRALLATPDAEVTLDGEVVYRSYMRLDEASRPGTTTYVLAAERTGATARGASTKGAACADGKKASPPSTTAFKGLAGSVTTLDRCTVERAASKPIAACDDVEAFACGVNTIAHEWAHAVVDPETGGPRYLDRASRPGHASDVVRAAKETTPGPMLASVALGAVAQCTYLEAGGHLPGTFEECVRAVGVSSREAAVCRKGWAKKNCAP